jgi:RHS repeat-associated protein
VCLWEKQTARHTLRIEFIYDATGAKLRKTVFENNAAIETRDYINGKEYKGGVLDRFAHTEGAVVRNENTVFEHQYVIKDHLGNARITYRDGINKVDNTGNTTLNDGTIVAADMMQINHYYPFGMNMEGNWNGLNGKNKYQYNEKELNSDFGLDLSDYGARFYDAAIGRFPTIDILASVYANQTPYAYAANNPISFIDFMGMGPQKEDPNYKPGDDPTLHTGITVTAQKSNASSSWKDFIGQWSNDDFQAFRKGPASNITRSNMLGRLQSYNYGRSTMGMELDEDAINEFNNTDYTASEDEAMSLLKEMWAVENSISGMNYLSIKAETVATTQEAVPVLAKATFAVVTSWAGTKITAEHLMLKQWGPRANWIRMDKTFSKSGNFNTYGIKWGASMANKGKYLKQIPSPALKIVNQQVRNFKLPGNGWRTADPGHFHFWKL